MSKLNFQILLSKKEKQIHLSEEINVNLHKKDKTLRNDNQFSISKGNQEQTVDPFAIF